MERNFLNEHNPANHWRKKRTLRQLNVETRLQIAKLAASKTRSHAEIALAFNIKVQLVGDLMKDAKKKQVYFVKKKQAELRRAEQEAAIVLQVRKRLLDETPIWSAKQI